MSVKQFKLPDPGEGLTEAEIVTWKVKAGRHGQGQRHRRRDRDRQVARRAAGPVRRHGDRAARRRGRDGRGRHADHRRRHRRAGAPDHGAGRARRRARSSPASRGQPGAEDGRRRAAAAEEEIEEGKIGGTTSTGRTAVLVGYGVKQTEAKRRPRKAGAAARGSLAAPQRLRPSDVPASGGRPRARPRPPRPRAAQPVVGREGGAPCAGQAAGPQARQGPRRRPGQRGRVGRGRHHHPRRRRGPRGRRCAGAQARGADGSRRRRRGIPGPGLRPLGRAGAAHPGQGRAQDDRPGDGRLARSPRRTSPSGSPSTSRRRWSSSSGSRQDREFKDVKVTPLLVLAKALCLAIRRNPEINATWDEAAQEIVVKHYVNLGIAAATPRGLIVPEHQGRRPDDDAPAGRGHRRADRDGARGSHPAGRHVRRHHHDHQRRRLRRRHRHADHQPGRVGDPGVRRHPRQPWVVTAATAETIEPR